MTEGNAITVEPKDMVKSLAMSIDAGVIENFIYDAPTKSLVVKFGHVDGGAWMATMVFEDTLPFGVKLTMEGLQLATRRICCRFLWLCRVDRCLGKDKIDARSRACRRRRASADCRSLSLSLPLLDGDRTDSQFILTSLVLALVLLFLRESG